MDEHGDLVNDVDNDLMFAGDFIVANLNAASFTSDLQDDNFGRHFKDNYCTITHNR